MADGDRVLAGRYRLERRIGRGGAGTVWRAHDTVLDRAVALKILHAELTAQQDALDRFRREAVHAAALNHPNAVVLHDFGQDEDDAFLVMELVDGPTVATLLRRHGRLEPTAVADIGAQAARALGAAHQRELVHRDIKPANLLLTEDGVVKVADFGIAKALGGTDRDLTRTGLVLGTASYLSPEQLGGGDVGAPSDVYALGVVLYECLVGRVPFSGETLREIAVSRLSVEALHPREERTEVPEGLDATIARATHQDADQRFRDGQELAAALDELTSPDGRPVLLGLATGTARDTAPITTEDLPATRGARGDTAAEEATTASRPTHAVGPAPAGTRSGDDRRPGTVTEPTRWRWAVPAAVALAVVGLLVFLALTGGGGGGDGPQALPIADAQDFDPFSEDNEEHPEDVAKAYDGDLSTAWVTQRYETPDLGGLKDGVGIWFDLGEPRPVREVQMRLAEAGVTLELYALDGEPTADRSSWGEPVGRQEDAPAELAFTLDGARGRYWLLWITRVPEGDGRAELAEIVFVGA